MPSISRPASSHATTPPCRLITSGTPVCISCLAAAAERIVEGELDRFTAWWGSLDAAPIVRSMWQQAEEIRRREFDRALYRMTDLPPEQVEIVEAMTRSIVKKLLHDPTSFLKERADRSQLESAEALFKLWKDQ